MIRRGAKTSLLGTALFLILVFSANHTVRAQDLTPNERAALQAQYDELQKEIAAQQQIITDTQAKKKSLQGDVTLLNAQIAAAQAQIAAKNIVITQLAAQIAQKTVVINQLTDRIDRGKESLASILRQEDQIDSLSIVEVALSRSDLSSFYADVDAFFSLKTKLQSLFTDIQTAKAQTETEKANLAEKQNQTVDAKYVVETKKQQIVSNKTEKQQLLAITANQEVEYKKVLADRQARAAAIRAALFPLRDAAPIQFADALAYAKKAQAETGIRPAFILAVLTQESNLGSNVGQCYLANTVTGAGINKKTNALVSNVMKPGRDIPPFVDLGTRLGFDPLKQVVSCPQSSGWGGAMGPAQFIPSTWQLYESRIASVTGHAVPNPWAADDAIAAMSVYFDDLGAGAGGYTAEHTAAAKYYAGGAWATAGRSYANSVMALAESIQNNIDFLVNN
ncbi:lytic murein transglycosylase [Patescibacteria group bacterium]|nr:lytic murein transglycosylase [Patescibacteria group bacterium]